MKNFEILRYIKRWRVLIVLFSILCTGFIYFFLSSKQTYIATTKIEYTNEGATSGLAPNGEKIDTNEIYSSKNITKVIDELGLDVTVDNIRSRCKVSKIIPSEEKAKEESALKTGKDYEYSPVKYKVTFTADASKSKEYAQKVLDTVISKYFESYGEKYITKETLSSNASKIIKSSYDYLENAEIIKASVDESLYYLENMKTSYPDFRSSRSGYSFSDLYNEYYYLSQNNVSDLSAMILQKKTTKDKDILLKKYNARIHKDEITIKNNTEKLKKIQSLIKTYAKKSKSETEYNFGSNSDNDNTTNSSNYILNNVYNDQTSTTTKTNEKTTYDQLLLNYVDLKEETQNAKIDKEYSKMILKTFKTVSKTSSEKEIKQVTINTKQLLKKIDRLYIPLGKTAAELNQYLGAQNINMLTSIRSIETINVKIYMMLAYFLFIIMGCLGAIFIGRISDFIEYSLYIDKKTNLPNRIKNDEIIAEYAKKPLVGSFSIVSIQIKNLKEINDQFGRKNGDIALREFGSAIKTVTPNNGFSNYNGGNQFFLFLPDKNTLQAEMLMEYFENTLLNATSHPNIRYDYSVGIAEANKDETYNIRELIVLSIKNTREKGEV